MSVCLIDTSVFCNIIQVPNKCQDHKTVMSDLKRHIKAKVTLLLPMATILETGNHVAQVPDGNLRWQKAQRFVQYIQESLDGKAPWRPVPFVSADDLRTWIAEFPDSAKKKQGMGDLSIIKEFDRQCLMNKGRLVFIWSFDSHLASFRREPDLS